MSKSHVPYQIKISYSNQLEIKLMVRQALNFDRFDRHTLLFYKFNSCQSSTISKKFFSYITQGQYLKIINEYYTSPWIQKSSKDFPIELTKLFAKPIKNLDPKNLSKLIDDFYQSSMKKSYNQLQLLTIFTQLSSDSQQFIEMVRQLQQINKPRAIISIFTDSQFNICQIRLNKYKWIKYYNAQSIDTEIRKLFYQIKKIGLRSLKMSLQIINAKMILKKYHIKGYFDWFIQNGQLVNQCYYLQSNKCFVQTLQFRNLGYCEEYKFKLTVFCQDLIGNNFTSNKIFILKPSRNTFNDQPSHSTLQNHKMLQSFFSNQQSLCFDSLSQHYVLQSLKIIGNRVFIQIKDVQNYQSQI